MIKYKISENREIEINATIDELNYALSRGFEFFRVWVGLINDLDNDNAIMITNDYVDEMSA